jgi:translation elongation factor EF-1alpha
MAEKKEKKQKQIGEVTNYFDHVKAAAIRLKAGLKKGDTIHVTGGEIDFEQEVKGMQIDRKDVEKAKKGDEVGIIVKEKVRKGYKVFKK